MFQKPLHLFASPDITEPLNCTIHGREIQLWPAVLLHNQLSDHGEQKLLAHMTNPYDNCL